ncbi:MAG: hypothetical protein GYA15_08725 [Leptolinea sp.]|jgi:WD40 repeat protein|nr:hypothetical protein [Leptolinea sp.]
MEKKWIITLIIISLVITSLSCGISVDLGPTFSSPTPLPPTATATLPPAMATSTTVPPTLTSTAAATEPVPEDTAIAPEEQTMEVVEPPTETPTAKPEPQLQVISPANASGLTFRRVEKMGSGSLQKIQVSPDGNSILFCYSAYLYLLKMSDFSVIWKVDPGRFIADAAFSKDGEHLITASPGGSVRMFDVATGNLLATIIPQREGVRSLSLSGNGEYFAILDYSGTTTIWDTGNGKQVQDNNGKASPGGVNSILLSPGGGVLLIDGIDSKVNKQVQQWNVTDGKYKIGLLGVIQEMVNWKFSPDAKRIFGVNTRSLTASPANTLTAWNALNGAIVKRYDSLGIISDYQISPDGSLLLMATEDHQIHLLDTETGNKKGTFTGHAERIIAMTFTPDGQGVISFSADGQGYLWDVANFQAVGKISLGAPAVRDMSGFSGQANMAALLMPGRRQIGVVDMATFSGKVVGTEEYLLRAPAISPQGNRVAAIDDQNRLLVWDVGSGEKITSIDARTRKPIKKLKFAPNEKLITSISEGQIMVWEIESGKKLYELTGQNDFAFSPTERIIISDSLDNKLYVSNADNGRSVYSAGSEYVNAIAFSPGGEYLAVGATKVQPVERGLNNLIYQMDTHSKERLAVEMPEIPGSVSSIAYSPDMKMLAATDSQGNVHMWSLLDGKKVALFEEIAVYPGTLAFNKEGTILYVAGGDGTIGMVSTTGETKSAENAPATTTSGDTIPDLSAQPYTHSYGSVTANLPMGWQLEEQSSLMFTSSDPKGIAAISFMAINTVKPLTDEGFLNFIDGSEQIYMKLLDGYKEIDRGVEPTKGTGFVSASLPLAGKEYVFETYYTRDGATIQLMNFLTQKSYLELYLPLYQGVFASLKVNKDFVKEQSPYSIMNTVEDTTGKISYSVPQGWRGNTPAKGTEQAVIYTAPDDSCFLRLEDIAAPQGDDTQTFIAIQTRLEEQEKGVIIVRRDKTDTGGWQITYNVPAEKRNGIILGLKVDTKLKVIHVQYPSEADAVYRPLAQKIVNSLKTP